jgi:hypothetical protein
MENVIHSMHGFGDALRITDISDIKFQFVAVFRVFALIQMPHVVLL